MSVVVAPDISTDKEEVTVTEPQAEHPELCDTSFGRKRITGRCNKEAVWSALVRCIKGHEYVKLVCTEHLMKIKEHGLRCRICRDDPSVTDFEWHLHHVELIAVWEV